MEPQDPKIDPRSIRYVDADFDSSRGGHRGLWPETTQAKPDYPPTPGEAKLNKPDYPPPLSGPSKFDPTAEGCCVNEAVPRRLFTQEQLKENENDARRGLHNRVAEFIISPTAFNQRMVDLGMEQYQTEWMTGRRRVTVE